MRQLRATGERNRLRIAEPPQQSRHVFLRLKSPPEGGIWGGVRLVNDANGGDNTIGSKPTERKINKLHKRMNNKYSLPKDGGLISESAPRDIIHRYEKIHTKVYENESTARTRSTRSRSPSCWASRRAARRWVSTGNW